MHDSVLLYCQSGMTSVHWAASMNNHDAIRKLLALRGDLSLQDLVSHRNVVTARLVCVFAPMSSSLICYF
jgi:hypothetical protein